MQLLIRQKMAVQLLPNDLLMDERVNLELCQICCFLSCFNSCTTKQVSLIKVALKEVIYIIPRNLSGNN